MTNIVSFNLNGLSARLKNGSLANFISDNKDADHICLQEVKVC